MHARLASVLVVLAFACEWNDWESTDRVEILQELASPDGEHIATAFECTGGGAAGYVYVNVNLRKATEAFNQRDVVLGRHLWSSFGEITLRWIDADVLEVSYAWATDHPEHREKNDHRVEQKHGVEIRYLLKETD